ncbi:hypothetical protein D9756_001036 [Leucocoprinus leucothites]|uniref:Uncharacterized protein n=1 Tax=Leucocoprinus leucothites TaxID=201217 RepID=A0A8H5GEC7_9AGAR|nr:hypothetical protein D9756_001036 [Leucoagaricus leucothites]
MIPPIEWISNALLASTFSVGHNAAKNLIFRASSLLLQYTVFKTLSYIAHRLKAYTSFLMLLEDFVQKLYFIRSYGLQEHSWIIIAFLILFPAAGVYDTCIWMLDAPGYIIQSTVADAQSFSHQLLPNPSSILNIPGKAGEINLERIVSADLYAQNLTLVATHLPISQEVVAPLRKLSSDVQPRIWLDNEGWSVGFDLGWPTSLSDQTCTPNSTDTQQRWSCHFNNTNAAEIYTQSFGSPRIWWDTTTTEPNVILPYFQDPTSLLGPSVSSAAMKQLFTLTKAQRQHTFLQTSWKATMQTALTDQFQSDDILDFVRRGWSNDPDQIVTPEIQNMVKEVTAAQSRGNSYSAGVSIQEPQPFAIRATVIELLTLVHPINGPNAEFSSLRIRSINTTLLRSESLSSPDTPQTLASCPSPFTDTVVGGQVRNATTCPGTSSNSTTGSLKHEIDVSAVTVLPNILGKGNTNTSQDAFDPQGQSWIRVNQAHLDELMASRAMVIQGRDGVNVAWEEPVAAISYLQVILITAPALLAFFSWTLMAGNATSHYKHSFFATVCATAHVSDNSCRRVGYLKNPPRIELKTLRRHVVIGTPNGGTLTNVEHDQVVAYSMVTEPLNLPVSMMSQAKGDDTHGP